MVHFALIELIAIREPSTSEAEFAAELGISKLEVSTALRRLESVGLICRIGPGFQVNQRNTKTTHSAVQSDAIIKVHTQLIEKAKQALVTHTLVDREFGSLILAFDRKKRIREFRKKFNAEFAPTGAEESVYCLSTQFFSLNEVSQ